MLSDSDGRAAEHVANMVKFFKKHDTKDMKVLELGAGHDKDFKNWLGDKVKSWDCTDKLGDVLMEDLPYDDDEYDIIFSCHAFEHCEEPVRALREFKRVAKKWIIILTPYHCEHQILRADHDHIFCLTAMQMKRLFKYIGIDIEKIYVQCKYVEKSQNYNLVSIGKVK